MIIASWINSGQTIIVIYDSRFLQSSSRYDTWAIKYIFTLFNRFATECSKTISMYLGPTSFYLGNRGGQIHRS